MKKILLLSLLLLFSMTNVKAISFEDAYNQSGKTPLAVFIYAEWAEGYQQMQQIISATALKFQDKYNFVDLNIASPDAKFFNTKYHIYPNLPYVLLFKENGRLSRYVNRECVSDQACLETRLKQFMP